MRGSATQTEYAWFTRAEMERRWSAAHDMMEARGIDVLLVSGEENFQYFAGSSASLALHQSLTRPSVLLLPLGEEPIAITQGGPALEGTSHVTKVRGFDSLLEFPAQCLLDALADAGLRSARRIGAELGKEQRMGMPVGTLR